MLIKLKDNIQFQELEKLGFEYTTDDRWCGSDRVEKPRYEKEALITKDNKTFGYCYVDCETKELFFEAEWWYPLLEKIFEKELNELLESGMFIEVK